MGFKNVLSLFKVNSVCVIATIQTTTSTTIWSCPIISAALEVNSVLKIDTKDLKIFIPPPLYAELDPIIDLVIEVTEKCTYMPPHRPLNKLSLNLLRELCATTPNTHIMSRIGNYCRVGYTFL